MKKFLGKLKGLIPTKRRLIQLYSALLFNANLEGFFKGTIAKGGLKGICTPGLNCYSCPGASGACPLGSLQSALNGSTKRTPYYVIGIILLYGIIFGRFICGFLCPFGLIQELLHKVKTPKLKKNKFTRVLSYLKYVILVFLVVIVPILYGLKDVPLPGFCKYICPAGTLEGAMGYLSNAVNEGYLASLGPLFTWKFALLVSFVLGSIFIFRFFCRFFCPLGALYGFFNKISLVGVKLDKKSCTNCGLCHSKCGMDIKEVGDHECINCGECISVCPTEAITWKGSSFFLPRNAVLSDKEKAELVGDELAAGINEKNEAERKKAEKKKLIVKITAIVLMIALLTSAIVYHNFIDVDKTRVDTELPPVTDDGELPPVGSAVGYRAPSFDIPLFDETGLIGTTFDPADNKGKITIVNFWGTWCPGCVKELPYFDRIATDYKDSVDVIAIHTETDFDKPSGSAPEYVDTYYKDSDMLFGKDNASEEYFFAFGGGDAYPITVIIDENGIITHSIMSALDYEKLASYIDGLLAK